jgi:dihydroxy-acid dehydratase
MGTRGMSYSLQSRDLIADQVETAAGGHWLDGMVVVPGCDKNMPGVLIARASFPLFLLEYWLMLFAVGRLNRPSLMVYGGTIRAGSCGGQVLDVVNAFQSYGKYLQDGKTEAAEKERYETVRNSCPGPGACGGVRLSSLFDSARHQLTLVTRPRCTPQIPWHLLLKHSA